MAAELKAWISLLMVSGIIAYFCRRITGSYNIRDYTDSGYTILVIAIVLGTTSIFGIIWSL